MTTDSSTLRCVPSTTTVRVRPETRERLNRLARGANVSAAELLARLVEREEQDQLLQTMNDDFDRMHGNPPAWRDFKAETALWDAASDAPDHPR